MIHEPLKQKPDWWIECRLCSSRSWYKEIKINLSNIFPHTGNNDTGLQLSTICLSPFLGVGQMFDFFQLSGNMLSLIQYLNIIVSGFTIAESHIFNILIDISSYPCALHGWRALIIWMISFFFKFNWTNFSICHITLTIRKSYCHSLMEHIMMQRTYQRW